MKIPYEVPVTPASPLYPKSLAELRAGDQALGLDGGSSLTLPRAGKAVSGPPPSRSVVALLSLDFFKSSRVPGTGRSRLVRVARWLAAVSLGGALGCAAPGSKEEIQDPAPARADDSVPAGSDEPAGETPPVKAVEQAVEPAPVAPAEPEPPAWTPREQDRLTPHRALEFPGSLAGFFDRLAVIDDGEQEVVRIVHLGASMIGADDLPGILRHKFQTRFGDGGAGLVLLQRYMPNYLNRWVKLQADGWDHCYIAFLCKRDGYYGLGGTTFWSDGGAKTMISTRDRALGGTVSKFEVWYAAHKKGGKLQIRIDKQAPETISTRADALEDRYHAIDVEPGPHKIRLKAAGYGRVRGYGVVLETDGPGLTWEQFSMLGAFTRRMLAWDPDHIAGQVAHRDPDLIVFTYGGNDSRRVANGKLTREQYVDEYSQAVARVRAGKPGVPCLITAVTDRSKSLSFSISAEHMEMLVDAQREVAEKEGCGFFDSFAAMGGAGSLKKWLDMDPPLASADLKHLNHRGREKLAGWIYDAIIDAYVAHRTGREPG